MRIAASTGDRIIPSTYSQYRTKDGNRDRHVTAISTAGHKRKISVSRFSRMVAGVAGVIFSVMGNMSFSIMYALLVHISSPLSVLPFRRIGRQQARSLPQPGKHDLQKCLRVLFLRHMTESSEAQC
jgi:hypothetical protein